MALDIHFLNVGKGSCTIINPPSGRLTVVDIDNSAEKVLAERSPKMTKGIGLTNPLNYLNSVFPSREIFRFILTHPDMDHMSGIRELFLTRKPLNFWDIEHSKELTDWESSPYDKKDWDFYKKLRSRCYSDVTVLNLTRNSIGNYWTPDNIQILHPHHELQPTAQKADEYDHLSYVLKIQHAGRHILLCGDATPEALESIYYDPSTNEAADFILAPGHGSKNHVHKDTLNNIGHKLTIVSVAEGVDYDHDFYSKFGPVMSTKYYGNIRLFIDDYGTEWMKTQYRSYSNQWYQINF